MSPTLQSLYVPFGETCSWQVLGWQDADCLLKLKEVKSLGPISLDLTTLPKHNSTLIKVWSLFESSDTIRLLDPFNNSEIFCPHLGKLTIGQG